MTLDEIKQAVDGGKTVHYQNPAYAVISDRPGRYLIRCYNGHCIGLTWADGLTMNGKPEDFYVDEEAVSEGIIAAEMTK